MPDNPQLCPDCGTPVLNWLGGNCPACLLRLTPLHTENASESAGIAKQKKLDGKRCLGDFELIEEIARGGMGVVFRARQKSLKRLVAVKVLIGGQCANELARTRFHREAEAVAALNHPNIVSIYEIGEENGELYFAMELVEGRNLSELAREKPLEPREAAQIVKATAEGVHYAHQKQVLHRDLKPSNVLVDSLGVPRITDFGLAKQMADDANLTLSGQVVGTPNYMPPEQADSSRGPMTLSGDVYSLGAILYYLLAGRPPFQANTLTATLHQVMEQEPVPVRLLDSSVPRDLETICSKCLEKSPKRRYASARELADELQRFLNGEPIQARPIGAAGRLARWCLRSPRLAFATISAAVLLGMVTVGTPIAAMRINRERKQAEAAELRTRQQLYTALVGESRAAVLSAELGHRVNTLEALQRAAEITNSPELRQEALAALRLPDLRPGRESRRKYGGSPTAWALDPTFERVTECPEDGSVEILSATSGTLLVRLPPNATGRADRVTWSADGRYLALKRGRPMDLPHWRTEVWDVGSCRCIYSNSTSASRPVFNPNSRELLDAKADGSLIRWDLQRGQASGSIPAIFPLSARKSYDRGLLFAFNQDGSKIAEGHFDDPLSTIVIRGTDGSEILRISKSPLQVSSISWQPGGSWVALTDFAGSVCLLDADSGEIRTLGHHKVQAVSSIFCPDGHYLFTGGWENEMICWDVDALQKSFSIPLNSYIMQFRSDGTECVLDGDTSWRVCQFERPSPRRISAELLGGNIHNAAFSTDDRWLAVAGLSQLGVWDMISSAPPAFTPDGADERLVFSGQNELYGCRDFAWNGWQISESSSQIKPLALQKLPLPEPKGFVSICAHGSNELVLTSGQGSTVSRNGQFQEKWIPTASGLTSSSPDDRWMAVFAPYSPIVHVYSLPGLTLVADLTNSYNAARVKFSPNGPELSICMRESVAFWSTNTWTKTRSLTNIMNLIFSPRADSYWLIRDYQSSGLYSAEGLRPLLPLPRGSLPLVLSRDGRFVAVSTDTKFIEVWDLVEIRRKLRLLGMDWPDGK